MHLANSKKMHDIRICPWRYKTLEHCFQKSLKTPTNDFDFGVKDDDESLVYPPQLQKILRTDIGLVLRPNAL
jgi:hypothetical protein